MAATALKIPKDGKYTHLFIVSTPIEENKTDVQICLTGDTYVQSKMETLQEFMVEKSEEDYHKSLRKESNEKGHFIRDYSTNPEWNPE